jgi:hypothetical protein
MKIFEIYNSSEQEEIKLARFVNITYQVTKVFHLLPNLYVDWDTFVKLYPGYKAYKVKNPLHDFYVLKYNGIGFLIVDINLVTDSIEHYVTDKENFAIFIKLAMTKSQYVNLYTTTSLDFDIPD